MINIHTTNTHQSNYSNFSQNLPSHHPHPQPKSNHTLHPKPSDNQVNLTSVENSTCKLKNKFQ